MRSSAGRTSSRNAFMLGDQSLVFEPSSLIGIRCHRATCNYRWETIPHEINHTHQDASLRMDHGGESERGTPIFHASSGTAKADDSLNRQAKRMEGFQAGSASQS